MVSAVISAFLYLRIIVAMFMSGGDDGTEDVVDRSNRLHVPFAAGLAIGICVVVTIGYGIFPDLLLHPARNATPAAVQYERPTDSLNLGTAGSSSGSTTAGR
jgi:NADH:ubiquinone oxidoreductase subunit 2 (subunit N)